MLQETRTAHCFHPVTHTFCCSLQIHTEIDVFSPFKANRSTLIIPPVAPACLHPIQVFEESSYGCRALYHTGAAKENEAFLKIAAGKRATLIVRRWRVTEVDVCYDSLCVLQLARRASSETCHRCYDGSEMLLCDAMTLQLHCAGLRDSRKRRCVCVYNNVCVSDPPPLPLSFLFLCLCVRVAVCVFTYFGVSQSERAAEDTALHLFSYYE